MSSCLRVLFGSALLLAFASPSPALTINASDSGWHSSAGNHTASNQDYVAGWVTDTEYHDFFVFDLSTLAVTETILSATLHVYNPRAGQPNASFTNGYHSPAATDTYNLRHAPTPPHAAPPPPAL